MADNLPAKIEIGGIIPRSLLDELAGVIESSGLSADWGDATLDVHEIKAAIVEAFAKEDTVTFVDVEARYGEFDELERHCTINGIDFDRHNDAKYEHEAENVYGRGCDDPVTFSSNQAGHNFILVETVQAALDGLGPPLWITAPLANAIKVPPALTPIKLVD